MTAQGNVDPAAFLSEYTSIAVPAAILGLALLGLIIIQVILTVKSDSLLAWLIPLFLGVAGGFSCLATMSYYQTFSKIAENNLPYLTPDVAATVPNFSGYSVTFLAGAVFFFSSIFISFLIGAIKAIRRHNMYG